MSATARNRVGILGGTFNPIHIGHLVLAQDALERFELTTVLFIPCAAPPHKTNAQVVSGQHRMAMIEAAIEWNPSFEACALELERKGVSYAIDTVTELRSLHPGADLFFLIGLDMLVDLHKWRRIAELLPLCRFISFGRPGYECPPRAADLQLDPAWAERLLQDVVPGRHLDISSTDIRYRVAEGLSIKYLVPAEVEMYISEHGLYRQ